MDLGRVDPIIRRVKTGPGSEDRIEEVVGIGTEEELELLGEVDELSGEVEELSGEVVGLSGAAVGLSGTLVGLSGEREEKEGGSINILLSLFCILSRFPNGTDSSEAAPFSGRGTCEYLDRLLGCLSSLSDDVSIDSGGREEKDARQAAEVISESMVAACDRRGGAADGGRW